MCEGGLIMKILKIFFSRFTIIALLIIIQVAVTLGLFWYLQERFFYVNVVIIVLSVFLLLHIMNKEGNPSHKIPWIILILLHGCF